MPIRHFYIRHSLRLPLVALLTTSLLLGACDLLGSSSGGSNVNVGFSTSYSSSSSASSRTSLSAKSNHDSLVVSGSNGTLQIDDIRLIVSGVELEGEADSAEFEADPTFLDLPLDTTDVAPVTTSEVPPATYNEFEFEVEDVDIEENDDDEQALRALREEIRGEFPDWPEGASMVVEGSFTPSGDTTAAFTAFFEAEIEVEQELSPPLEVTSDGLSRNLTVRLDPTRWFSKADGTVQNLAQIDYGRTENLIEFEAEFEDGVAEIEVDGDGDDD